MTDTDALSELARFIAGSPLASDKVEVRESALLAVAQSIAPQPRKKVSDLLGTVMALTARTRRMIQPRTGIDLDVFTPDNRRAVYLTFGETDSD